jgi:AAA family ATP:ADP antiporter
VRAGDVFAAALVWVGTTTLAIGPSGFAFVNIVLVGVWLSLAYILIRGYRQRTAQMESAA